VREQHRGHAIGVGWLVLGEPGQLGDREAGQRHRAGLLGPPVGAEPLHQAGGLVGRAGVVPQQGRPHHLVRGIQGDQAVLLPADRQRRDRLGEVRARLGDRLLAGPPPRLRIHLGAVWMAGPAFADDGARFGVDHQRLGGLGGRVNAEDEGHGTCLP
jgi:hypothetical protein